MELLRRQPRAWPVVMSARTTPRIPTSAVRSPERYCPRTAPPPSSIAWPYVASASWVALLPIAMLMAGTGGHHVRIRGAPALG